MTGKEWAVIFDMDGTMLDNNPYHLKAWQAFCKKYGITLTEEEYKNQLSGRSSSDTMQFLFQKPLSEAEISLLRNEKEQLYRRLVQPHIRPIKGLPALLASLQAEGIKMAIASSATPVNLRFALGKLQLEPYFTAIVDSTMVSKGKPDPEIFLMAAKKLQISPHRCIVFEDSITGIRGAKAAGMKVIAITTAHIPEELKEADGVIEDYTRVSVGGLQKKIAQSG